jgi:hypothetical protein
VLHVRFRPIMSKAPVVILSCSDFDDNHCTDVLLLPVNVSELE